mmetsp:Transcript_9974/g.14681  ORF Transcript_9974/g.14681 Transcript_9974/m.14681 type:complete len:211 (-) Transcript_9974:33-665(-)
MATTRKRNTFLTPLAPIFSVLNWVAFFGWSRVLYLSFQNNDDLSTTNTSIFMLEGICLIEVMRIIIGDLPGNLVLGVILHAIRFTALTIVMPNIDDDNMLSKYVIWSWCCTEISRYPMYMFPNSQFTRSMRMVVPLVTFPWGCATEAYGAYQVLRSTSTLPWWSQGLLIAMLAINVLLGPTMAYPALLKKGLPVLGIGKKKDPTQKAKQG